MPKLLVAVLLSTAVSSPSAAAASAPMPASTASATALVPNLVPNDNSPFTVPGAGLPFGIALMGERVMDPEPVLALVTPGSRLVSSLALQSGTITGFDPERPRKQKPGKKPRRVKPAQSNEGLGPERARILLRSLTIPGWGQATLGHRTSAKVFMIAEAGVWGAFTAFKVQQAQRTQSYLLTARLDAGIDLNGRDDEFRRIVGAFASSEEYNLLVVTRDAANIYLSDPLNLDLAGYRAYIAKNSISGSLAWSWIDEQSFRRYSSQRKFAQKAGLRANTALGLAIANRLVSALHAARQAGHTAAVQQGWRFEVDPGLDAPGRYRAALTTRF